MFRLRVALTSYVGRCRYCRKVIVGSGKNTKAEFFELTYNGVKTSREMPMRRVLWHRRCYQKMIQEEEYD